MTLLASVRRMPTADLASPTSQSLLQAAGAQAMVAPHEIACAAHQAAQHASSRQTLLVIPQASARAVPLYPALHRGTATGR